MIRSSLGTLIDARAWRPTAARILLDDLRQPDGAPPGAIDDETRINLASRWLARAQNVTGDGGVAGRYHLATGWSSSYPETTGYLVPTFLRLESEAGISDGAERARRATDFLLGVQLPSGAFPGGEIHENRTRPSVFNTGQILNGLTAWHRSTGDDRTLSAAMRAADWLVTVQADDGAWYEHVYGGLATTYTAHASCWLVEFGNHVSGDRYLEAGRRHLHWVLRHRDRETGWFDGAGFNGDEHRNRIASAHPVAYTLWGAMLSADILGEGEAFQSVRESALRLAESVLRMKFLPGVLDHQWGSRSTFQCLTGNAQMALIWMRLNNQAPDSVLVDAARCVLDHVRASQVTERHPDVNGALAGSRPVWGDYIRLAYPNWAVKFFVDALLDWKALREAERAKANPSIHKTPDSPRTERAP